MPKGIGNVLQRAGRQLRRWYSPKMVLKSGAVTAAVLLVFLLGLITGEGKLSTVLLFRHASSQNPSLPEQLDYSSISTVYRVLKQNYNATLTTSQLLDGLKEGLAQSTNDPYTVYFNPKQAKSFSNELNNSFSGIGAELGKDADGNIIVVSPIKGYPADKAGLKPRDIITEIDGVSTSGMQPDLAVGKIRGPKGSTVTLTVIRDKSQTLTVPITRDDIKLPSVTTKTLDGNIGYIGISTFAEDTSSLAQQAAMNFKQAGVKGVVLDLRGNSGGYLNAAIDVSSLWLPMGKTILTEKGTDGTTVSTSNGNDPLVKVPTVVLIDGGSASASEITAGALHDDNAAYLIGEKSFGKGVVQQLFDLGDGSELKVTVASWYRPNGQSIQKKGITPDQTVDISDSDSKAGNDLQLTAAEAYLNR